MKNLGGGVGYKRVLSADLSGSRAIEGVYHNTTGKVLQVNASFLLGAIADSGVRANVGPTNDPLTFQAAVRLPTSPSAQAQIIFEVPVGYYYRISNVGAGSNIVGFGGWYESY
jgi:hypothetical protein